MAIPYVQKNLPQVATIDFDVTAWYGLNRKKGMLSSGEMYDAKNMSSDKFPYSSPRLPRSCVLSGIKAPQKLFSAGGKLGYISDGDLYFADEGLDFENKGTVGEVTSVCDFNGTATFFPSGTKYDYTTKTFYETLNAVGIEEGCYLYDVSSYDNSVHRIYPDSQPEEKIYKYDSFKSVTTKASTYDPSEPIISNDDDCQYAFIYCFEEPINVTDVKSIVFCASGIANDESVVYPDGGYILDQILHVTFYILPYKSSNNTCIGRERKKLFVEVAPNTEYKIPEGVNKLYVNVGYKVGRYNNVKSKNYNEYGKIAEAARDEDFEKLTSDPKKAYIWPNVSNYPETGSVPLISYATVDNNRIFAVCGNNIYASCQGNSGDWTTTADASNPLGAYAETMDTPGDFIGLTKYLGKCVLFKNDLIYESYNNQPPYQIVELSKTGCIDGKSICEVGSVLYFLGRDGIYSFTGGYPKLISENLNKKYISGTAGGDGRKYYLSAFDGEKYELIVYDTITGFWQREDDLNVVDFAMYDGSLYALTEKGEILRFGTGTERVNWEFTTQDYTFSLENTKNVKKLYIRCDMAAQTELEVFVRRNDGEFSRVAYYQSDGQTTFDFKVRIKKCDTFALKFKGKGNVRILDIHAKITQGTAKHRSGKNLSVFRSN